MAELQMRGVAKTYAGRGGEVRAVADLDLDVADGEFLALLGPSGCGKSSTLRMIVGLEEISAGEIAFDGRRVNELSPQERNVNVAMGFENYALYPNLTVRGNLAFPLELAGVPAAEAAGRIDRIASLLDIGAILDSRPAALSGGQQQRVSLGRALVREPAAFILDEVMSHVDAQLKFRMIDELGKVHREVGRTTVYVTHDQLEALALADRIAVMHEARLQQVGTRQDLFLRPANTFVAGFIGEPAMNLLPCEVRDGEVRLAGGMRLKHPGPAAAPAGGLILGFRPQHLVPDPAAEDLRAEVKVREYLGERVVYSMAAGDAAFKAVAPAASAHRPGAALGFAIAPGRCVFFDAKTGLLLD
ncbi:MAG: ABC transporter ATP-binding protein [Betaproteobacteria bacterium AqS2]|uniref:ABC transporter ATP-binding protein n=1 Tax=Candidatus Amphirhobacter heronislandensis TaxID=1732024 RepID=A0A930UCF7_9GAMM|nr:ABC transporter ATP-binding protein [Betaproteobacteria bacterium AqS2]